jgi:hypothetical protein
MNAAEIAGMITRAEQAGETNIIEVLRPAAAGAIDAAFVYRGARLSMRQLKSTGRPALAILGDDDYASTGPAAWPDAVRLLRWARFVILHGAGGEAAHYAAAVIAAQEHHRALLIETDTAHLEAWRALSSRIRPNGLGLIIVTRPDAPPHPTMRAPAGAVMQ